MTKGLEALEKLHRHSYNDMLEKIGCFKTIEKELKRLEELEIMYSNCVIEATKQKKALEIIDKKNVNVRAFKKVLLMKQNDDVKLRAYNSQNHREEDDLTKEEYDLIEEVLQ